MSRWWPIDTAPRDGTDILLFMPGHGDVMLVAYCDECDHGDYPWRTLDGLRYHKLAATHWMPLPPPPAGHSQIQEK